ncbi:DUF1488 family protein [Vibrio sp. TRT 17S01]|uniref:DUF1488 family protein n=1 Tax=Vibrio sp. TRT 17S01 TaxID=3418505 RepID=UPI003CEB4DA0
MWEIEEEWHWEVRTESIRFYLSNGEERLAYDISRIALVDYFNTDDTKEDAEKLFQLHNDRIKELAIKLVPERKPQDSFMINLDVCNRLEL